MVDASRIVTKRGLSGLKLLSPLLCFGILTSFILNANSQNIIYGVLLTPDSIPIPFATIHIEDDKGKILDGWVCDKNGFFAIEETAVSESDSIYFSTLGFEKKAILIKNLSLINNNKIELHPKSHTLNVVNVISKSKVKHEVFGTHKNRTDRGSWCAGSRYGYAVAVYIENKDSLNGFLKNVKIKFRELSSNEISERVRIHVYAVSDRGGEPGEELLPTSVFPTSRDVQGKWLKVDLSQYNIAFPSNGFFVGIEFLPKTFHSNNQKNVYMDDTNLRMLPSTSSKTTSKICLLRGKNTNAYSNTWHKHNIQKPWSREQKKLVVNEEWASEAIMGAEILFYEE